MPQEQLLRKSSPNILMSYFYIYVTYMEQKNKVWKIDKDFGTNVLSVLREVSFWLYLKVACTVVSFYRVNLCFYVL